MQQLTKTLSTIITASALAIGPAIVATAAPAQPAVSKPTTLSSAAKLARVVASNTKKARVPVTKANKKAAKAYAKKYLKAKYKSAAKAKRQYTCMVKVFNYESGWNWNSRSAAGHYGIPQTKSNMQSFERGSQNWRYHYEPQIRWGFKYMKSKYGSPCGAWKTIQAKGWY